MTETNLEGLVDDQGTMSEDAEGVVELAFEILGAAAYRNAVAHGWYDREEPRGLPEEIALIHSEVSEALEAYRDGSPGAGLSEVLFYRHKSGVVLDLPEVDGELNKPEGIAAEYADTVIRVADSAFGRQYPLGPAVIEKHKYNQSRPFQHGRKKA